MVQSWKNLSNRSCIWYHSTCSHDFGQVTSWYNCWWLIINSDFETSWAPVNKLNRSFCFYLLNRCIDIFWYNIASVHQRTRHIFAVPRIAFGHHVGRLERLESNFLNWKLLVISFLSWNQGSIWWQHKMNSGIWDKIGLQLCNVNIQSTIKSQWSSQWWDDLRNNSVQVGVSWSFNV